MLPAAHGDDPALPPNCQRVDVRNAGRLAPLLAGVDLVCHQAAVVGAGWTPPTLRPMAATTTTPLRSCWHRCSTPGCGVWCWPRRWWSTGRAGTLRRTRAGRSDAAAAGRPGRRHLRAPLPGRRRGAALAARRRGRCAAAAQPVRGQQDCAGALRAGLVGVDGRIGGGIALPQRLRPRNAARHPLLRGGGDLPLGDRKRRTT